MSNRSSLQLPPEWKGYFSATVLKRGQELARTGAVLDCNVFDNGETVVAAVMDPPSATQTVEVAITRIAPASLVIEGMCTCRAGFNCKHVTAALWQATGASDALPALPSKDDLIIEVIPARPLAPPAKPLPPLPPPKPTLSDQLKNWLKNLFQASAPPAPIVTEETGTEPERLAYVLNWEKTFGNASARPRLAVDLQILRRLQTGDYGQGRTWTFDSVLQSYFPQTFLKPVDEQIARRVKLIQPPSSYGHAQLLTGAEGGMLLEEILRTGRGYWRGTGKKHPPLKLGPPRSATPSWVPDNKGNQSPGFDVTPPATVILPVVPPWYLDPTTRECGPLETPLPPAAALAWCNAPTLTPDQAEALADELAHRPDANALPAPRRIPVENLTGLKPVPHLRLFSIEAPKQTYGWGYYGRSEPDEPETLNLAHLEFDYQGRRVSPNNTVPLVEEFRDGALWRLHRDIRDEQAQLAALDEFGFAEAQDIFYNYRLGKNAHDLALEDEGQWFNFWQELLPKLRADGWQIELDPSFQFRIAEPEDWYTDAESSGIDWFGVEVGVQIDGQRVNLLPILMEHLQKDPKALSDQALSGLAEGATVPIRLPDGRLLPFPAKRLRDMLGVLLELFEPKSLDRKGRLRLPKLRAAELTQLGGDTEWRWFGGAELRELSQKLRGFTGIQSVAAPTELRATLRGYQADGLSWLQFLRQFELAGVLADDMGLGKTVQALAHLLHEKAAGRMDRPSLVIAPTSLMTNWRQEAERFAPDLRVLVLHGLDRKAHFDKLREHDLVVTSYPLLPRDQAVLLEHDFHFVILDEAQYIKNPKTQYAQVACALKARHRLCLTGTPMENHLGELWSLFNFLLPGFLGDEVRFRKVFRNPIEKGASEERRKLLARRIAPFLLRRRKEEVVKELPAKTEIVQNVELEGAQRDLYETIRLAMHQRVREEVSKKGMSRAHIIILDALLKLRQVCCDPRLLDFGPAQKVRESAKLELLMDLLPEMIAEGRRILLFSQFTSMLALIEPELAKAKIPYVQLTGQTNDRATPVNRFQNKEVPLFLISLKAGGTGLNLTAADTVIHYDPWWNPAVENQATDRAHRIGQDKSVFVYKLMTVGTVEEKILQLQARKRELVEGLLNEERKDSLKLSSEDLDVLFAPIG